MHHSRGGACAHASDVATGRHGVNALRMNVGGGLAGIVQVMLLLLLLMQMLRMVGIVQQIIVLQILMLQLVLVVVGRTW